MYVARHETDVLTVNIECMWLGTKQRSNPLIEERRIISYVSVGILLYLLPVTCPLVLLCWDNAGLGG